MCTRFSPEAFAPVAEASVACTATFTCLPRLRDPETLKVIFGGVASTRRLRDGVAAVWPWMSTATTRQRCSPSATDGSAP